MQLFSHKFRRKFIKNIVLGTTKNFYAAVDVIRLSEIKKYRLDILKQNVILRNASNEESLGLIRQGDSSLRSE